MSIFPEMFLFVEIELYEINKSIPVYRVYI